MAKAASIISKALQKLGVLGAGETASGNDANDCLADLNTLIDSFPLDEFKSFTTQSAVVTLPGGASSMTIGSGQAIDVPRPAIIPGGGFCRVGDDDYSFEMVSRERYAAIGDKSWGGHVPILAYYDANAPTGLIYFYPVPSGDVQLHLPVPSHLAKFPDLTTDQALASGYERFLIYALAREVAPSFERAVTPDIERTYQGIIRSIKRTNFSVPELDVFDPSCGCSGTNGLFGGSMDTSEFGFKALKQNEYTGASFVDVRDNGKSHLKTDSTAVLVSNDLPITFLCTIINYSATAMSVEFVGCTARMQGAEDDGAYANWSLAPWNTLNITKVVDGGWLISGNAEAV